jgi:SHS2 domain-containing protein
MNSKHPSYEIIDHTADLGMVVKGFDVRNLFANAAYAMMDIMVEEDTCGGGYKRKIVIEGEDYPDLMVRWLGEIIYLFDAERQLVSGIEITAIGPNRLESVVTLTGLVESHYEIKTEIKAVTYHQISVQSKGGEWEAQVIFDI